MNKRVNAIFIVILIIGILGGFLFANATQKNPKLDKNSNYLIIGKKNLIAVYQDRLAVVIDYDINLDRDNTFGDLVGQKNGEEVLTVINKILPEKISEYVVLKTGQLKLAVKNSKAIPEITVENKRYILTSSLYSMFNTLYKNRDNDKNELNENITVDILNANGRNGYARQTGEKIKNKLGMKYNAANYEKDLEESYIVLQDISYKKAQDVVMQLDEKYLKIKQQTEVPTLSNIVIVLGKEKKLPFQIDVVGQVNSVSSIISDLKKNGYKKVNALKSDKKVESNMIEYNPEDYFIAYKISQILGIRNMLENNDLKNRIKIILN